MRRILLSGAVLLLALAARSGAQPAVPSPREHALILPPAGALVLPYANAGYRLEPGSDGGVEVEVSLAPIGSGTLLGPLPDPSRGPVERIAAVVASGAVTRYDAVSRVLGWVSREIRYELDRERPQDPEAVLVRRSAHCTGVARLTVALLRALGIEAREVAGFVAAAPAGGQYHRWVEIHYPDRGWVFSDPLRYHHYVPATYVPFASELVAPAGAAGGLLLAHEVASGVTERNPWAREGVRARGNGSLRVASGEAAARPFRDRAGGEACAPGARNALLASARPAPQPAADTGWCEGGR